MSYQISRLDSSVAMLAKEARQALELISVNKLEADELAKLRDALLPKLMSGEIDVSKVELS